jgi:alkaline phosphatase
MNASKVAALSLAMALVAAGCASTSETEAAAGAPEGALRGGPGNVILFLGDGMGVSTVTAARIFAGQQLGRTGEEHELSFERFPNVALVKTYNTDAQVADSAGTMSAIVTGVKTRIGHLSLPPSVPHNDCAAALGNELPTLLQLAEQRGLATGVVTTTRVTHATPAALYAHAPNRNWESDAQLPDEAVAAGCRDIARQLAEFDHGDGIEVILGGGRLPFLPQHAADPEYPDLQGIRTDGRDLIAEWQAAAPGRTYVWNRAQFDALPLDGGGPVLGLFEPSHMQFEADRAGDPAGEPSLAEMTAFAVQRLAAQGNRYFLMVEGGRIDHGHHAGNAYRALVDTVAFAEAVAVARQLTSAEDTLILVTADHSHTLTISGYPMRGNPILGKVRTPLGDLALDTEGRPYTTLGYANGPGFRAELPDLTDVDTTAADFQQPAAIPLSMETHAGEDVAAYADGPGAEAVRGVMEQNRLFDVMRDVLFPGGGL